MSRKSKIDPVEKVKIVERYLAGEIGICQAGRELGVNHQTIRNWLSIYQYEGPTGLLYQSNVNVNIKMIKKWKIKMYIFQDLFLSLCFHKGSFFF